MRAIGIDIGGTGIKIGIAEGANVLERVFVPTRADSDYSGILSDILSVAEKLKTEYRAEKVGIGCCGLIDSANGKVCYSNNVRWENVSLKQDISDGLHLHAFLANDAKCAALGEALYGAGKDFSRVLTLTLGTGVGGGFVNRGRMDTGNLYADASEILGHISVEKDGRFCTCGRKGCLEAYCSATALRKRAAEKYKSTIDVAEIFALAKQGENNALSIVNEFTDYLGVGICSLANVFRPEVVVVGGGISASAEMFLPKINERLKEEVFGYTYAPIRAVAARLGGDAGWIGATALS